MDRVSPNFGYSCDMKIIPLAIVWLLLSACPISGQTLTMYDDDQVASIYLELPPDSLDYLLTNLVNDRYLLARFIFEDGASRDTVEQVGLRLRGNTSLFAKKKSFKISFNEFVAGREYQGVRKLILRGQHNDPTMVREKLFYEVWEKAEMPERRAAFVRLYINQTYRGVYTNLEELDKTWLGRVYDDNDGNFYKCTWPADLVYLGPDQQVYKAIMNNPEERAYDLKTNEITDDYTRLVALMAVLNQPVTAGFPDQIREILNVESVLKSFAIDVATGNWDDYFYNKNNYYLYDNPSTGKFDFITFDTDNTLGVDWLGKDWAKRNCLNWLPANEPRPLATKLLAVPAFKEQYIRYIDTLTRLITHPDSIFTRIDALEELIQVPALSDLYRTLDYGYTFADFQNGFDQTIDNHTPYGIKPFLSIRYDSIRSQIAGALSNTTQQKTEELVFQVYPNPAVDWLIVKTGPALFSEKIRASIFGVMGQTITTWEWEASGDPQFQTLTTLSPGVYVLQLQSGSQSNAFVFVKAAQ